MFHVGIGFDAHRFSKGRKLILGGVEIPYARGLAGHSDADVLLHALADALLGAAGLGDLGKHFPDSDAAWKNAPSTVFIEKILIKIRGWSVVNADLTIIAQVPKIEPYRDAIRKSVARTLNCRQSLINLKATTTDSMGFIGRKEGIAAQAIVLLKKV
jgi:2-C-methyl-D-erythritol 2,4-cyclodiphosphate synthase